MPMNKIKTSIASLAILLASSIPALATVPWGSTAPLQQASATPTCTYTATAMACINKMTANVTSLTLAGMTAGTYYTMIWMQDGTGSRTLTQTAISGAPALSTAESAANGYAVWLIKATSASAATFITDYDNAPLTNVFAQAVTTNTAQAVAPGAAAQAAPTIVAPGTSTSSNCDLTLQALPSSWQTGLILYCIPSTNAVTLQFVNPGATNTITATANAVNVRILP